MFSIVQLKKYTTDKLMIVHKFAANLLFNTYPLLENSN